MSVLQKVKVTEYVEKSAWGWFGKTTWQEAVEKFVDIFVPEYEQHFVTSAVDGRKFALNDKYFATEETAQEVMKRLKGSFVFDVEAGGSGGVWSVDAKERYVMFPAWTEAGGKVHTSFSINAGLLADNWTRNKDHQDVAQKMAERAVESARV